MPTSTPLSPTICCAHTSTGAPSPTAMMARLFG